MRLPFFKLKSSVADKTELQVNSVQDELLKKLDSMLPLPSHQIVINYVFVCENGKDGEYFAAKLAEEDNAVAYSKNGTQGYKITGETQSIAPKEQLIKDRLLTMTESGIHFKCILTDFKIDTNK